MSDMAADNEDVYYTAQSKILAITPKIPALLSMAGSIYIVQNVLRHKEKRRSIYNRLMLGISISDILASHSYFLGTWLVPRGSGAHCLFRWLRLVRLRFVTLRPHNTDLLTFLSLS